MRVEVEGMCAEDEQEKHHNRASLELADFTFYTVRQIVNTSSRISHKSSSRNSPEVRDTDQNDVKNAVILPFKRLRKLLV